MPLKKTKIHYKNRGDKSYDRLLDAVFDVLPDLFFLLESDGTIIDYRASRKTDLYIPPEQFLGYLMQDVLPESVGNLFSFNIKKASATKKLISFDYVLHVNGKDKNFEARLSAINSDNQIIAVIRDVTEQKQFENKIIHQAHYDFLTEIPNRLFAIEKLEQMVGDARRNNKKFAVLFLDVDSFKEINDQYGHDFGDQLLKNIAERLRTNQRVEDTVGRLGGDEFIILLSGVSKQKNIVLYLENLFRQFERSIEINDVEVLVSVSVGASIYRGKDDAVHDLLCSADRAMYQAKLVKGNSYSLANDQ